MGTSTSNWSRPLDAFRYSIPVLLGYIPIGIAFGLLLSDAGYPSWLALVMSIVVYAGAAQYIAVALFAAGAGIIEIALITLIVNARHLAYGFSFLKRLDATGRYKPYLVFSLTDETFALFSALPDEFWKKPGKERGRFLYMVSAMNQSYWVIGSIIGALVGSLIPLKLVGLDFALTALFFVLVVEQYFRIRRWPVFMIAAVCSLAASFFLPDRIALFIAVGAALAAAAIYDRYSPIAIHEAVKETDLPKIKAKSSDKKGDANA